MDSVRIIAGKYKGRKIHFDNKKYDSADITSSKVKGAVFSMLGESLEGRSFLDLFAGSGQMGFEALSRGADPVVFNEPDPRRSEFIISFAKAIGEVGNIICLRHGATQSMRLLMKKERNFDVIFLDPPYDKTKGVSFQYRDILEKIEINGLLRDDGIIIIQHYSGNVLPQKTDSLKLSYQKIYGQTTLSIYNKSLDV